VTAKGCPYVASSVNVDAARKKGFWDYRVVSLPTDYLAGLEARLSGPFLLPLLQNASTDSWGYVSLVV